MITQDIANAITLHLQENLRTHTPHGTINLKYGTYTIGVEGFNAILTTTIGDPDDPPSVLKTIAIIYYQPEKIVARSQLPIEAQYDHPGGSTLQERHLDYTDPNLLLKIEDYLNVLVGKWAKYKKTVPIEERHLNRKGTKDYPP